MYMYIYIHVQYRSDARYRVKVFAFPCKRVCLLYKLILTVYKHAFASVYKCVCLLVQRGANYTPLIHVHVHIYTCTLHLICTVLHVLVHAHSVHVLLYRVLPRSRVDIEWCSSKEGRDFEGVFCRIFYTTSKERTKQYSKQAWGETLLYTLCTCMYVYTCCK